MVEFSVTVITSSGHAVSMDTHGHGGGRGYWYVSIIAFIEPSIYSTEVVVNYFLYVFLLVESIIGNSIRTVCIMGYSFLTSPVPMAKAQRRSPGFIRPEASSLLNLAALCQLCCNRHDGPSRRATRRIRRRLAAGHLQPQLERSI